jgi:hypothetical protein
MFLPGPIVHQLPSLVAAFDEYKDSPIYVGHVELIGRSNTGDGYPCGVIVGVDKRFLAFASRKIKASTAKKDICGVSKGSSRADEMSNFVTDLFELMKFSNSTAAGDEEISKSSSVTDLVSRVSYRVDNLPSPVPPENRREEICIELLALFQLKLPELATITVRCVDSPEGSVVASICAEIQPSMRHHLAWAQRIVGPHFSRFPCASTRAAHPTVDWANSTLCDILLNDAGDTILGEQHQIIRDIIRLMPLIMRSGLAYTVNPDSSDSGVNSESTLLNSSRAIAARFTDAIDTDLLVSASQYIATHWPADGHINNTPCNMVTSLIKSTMAIPPNTQSRESLIPQHDKPVSDDVALFVVVLLMQAFSSCDPQREFLPLATMCGRNGDGKSAFSTVIKSLLIDKHNRPTTIFVKNQLPVSDKALTAALEAAEMGTLLNFVEMSGTGGKNAEYLSAVVHSKTSHRARCTVARSRANDRESFVFPACVIPTPKINPFESSEAGRSSFAIHGPTGNNVIVVHGPALDTLHIINRITARIIYMFSITVTIDKYRGGHGKVSAYKDENGAPKINNIFYLISLIMQSHSRQQHHMELLHIYHRITGAVMVFMREHPIDPSMHWEQYLALMFVAVFHHMESTPIDIGAFISILQMTEYVAVSPVACDPTFPGNVARKFAGYRDILLRAPSSTFLISTCDITVTNAANGTTTFKAGRPKKGEQPVPAKFTKSIVAQTGHKNPFQGIMADATDAFHMLFDCVDGVPGALNTASRRFTVANGSTTRILNSTELPVSRIFTTPLQFFKRTEAAGSTPIPEMTPYNARMMVPQFLCEIFARNTHSQIRGPMQFMNFSQQLPRSTVIGPVRSLRNSIYRLYDKYARSDVRFFDEVALTDDDMVAYIGFYGTDEVVEKILDDPYIPERVSEGIRNIRATPARFMVSYDSRV